MKKRIPITLALGICPFLTGCSDEMNQTLTEAGLNTLMGMGTVFLILILISFLISLFKYIPVIREKFAKKGTVTEKKKAEAGVQGADTSAGTASVSDDATLVAVITAAICAAEGESPDGFVVRSFRRR